MEPQPAHRCPNVIGEQRACLRHARQHPGRPGKKRMRGESGAKPPIVTAAMRPVIRLQICRHGGESIVDAGFRNDIDAPIAQARSVRAARAWGRREAATLRFFCRRRPRAL